MLRPRALALLLLAALLWATLDLPDVAAGKGGLPEALRRIPETFSTAPEWLPWTDPASRRRTLQEPPPPGTIIMSVGPVLTRALSYARAPAGGSHSFPFGIQPRVAIQETGASGSAQITLRIRPGSGNPAAVLSCDGGLSRPITGGEVAFTGCAIDRPGAAYVLEAAAPDALVAASTPFTIRWAGDANDDCRTSITDFSLMLLGFGGTDPGGDFNRSGTVDGTDFSILLAFFGKRCPAD